MEHYKRELDAVMASDAYKESLKCAMEQALEKGSAPVRGGRAKKAARRKKALVVLAPIAAAVLIVAGLMSIPSVSRAVSSFFIESFRLFHWVAAAPDQREENADLSSALQTPPPETQDYQIKLLNEMEDYADIDGWRRNNGAGAYNPDDWQFLYDIKPGISEIFYDGARLYIKFFYETDPIPFMRSYCSRLDAGLRLDLFTDSASIANMDGSNARELVWMTTGLETKDSYWGPGGENPNVEAIRADKGVFLITEFDVTGDQALAPGKYKVMVKQRIIDTSVDGMANIATVGSIEQTFTLDTATMAAKSAQIGPVIVAFNGVVPLTVRRDGGRSVQTEQTDLAGVTAEATAIKRPTGLQLTIDYAFPEGWGEDEVTALTKGGNFTSYGQSLEYEVQINGEAVGSAERVNGSTDFEIPLTGSELSGVSEIVLVPIVHFCTAIDMGKGYTSLDEPYALPWSGDYSYELKEETTRLSDCAITLPLS